MNKRPKILDVNFRFVMSKNMHLAMQKMAFDKKMNLSEFARFLIQEKISKGE